MTNRRRPPHVDPGPITAGEVRDMLLAAKAPADWESPDACTLCAGRLSVAASELAYLRAHPIGRRVCDRANDAVDELRRVLPQIKAWASLPVITRLGPPPEIAEQIKARQSEYLEKLTRLEAALFEIWPRKPRGQKELEDEWECRAVLALACYAAIVGREPGLSRNSPAVRFALSVLKRLGDGVRSGDAIVAAVRRRSGKNDDKSLMSDLSLGGPSRVP